MDKRKNNGGHTTINAGRKKVKFIEPTKTIQIKVPISDVTELKQIASEMRELKKTKI